MRYLAAALTLFVVLSAFVSCRKGPKDEEILPPPKIVKSIPVDANPLRKTVSVNSAPKCRAAS